MVALMADRQRTSSKGSGTIKRVISSPTVRPLVDGENGDISSADKKRNKLGYHRTAVACGHCRRRKIRCIPATDTSSSRCQNCIRLKKECQFYPVDQNATTPIKKTRSESKGDPLTAESETSVSSSSPRLHPSVPVLDHFDQYRAPVHANSISQNTENDYPHPFDNRNWYSNEQPPQYWLQHDPNHSNSFTSSPYQGTPTTTRQPITTPHHSFTYPTLPLDHSPNYSFSQRSRDTQLSSQNRPTSTFGDFRSNTLPEKIGIGDDIHRVQAGQETILNLSSQQLMGPPFSTVHGSPTQYTSPTAHQMWMPSASEPQHQPTGYVQHGPPPAWFHHADGLNDVQGPNGSHTHLLDSASREHNRLRQKPG